MFAQKTTLKQAVDIIADPAVDEKKWLAACTVVGDKKIALNEPCPVKTTGTSFANALYALLMMGNMVGVFVAANFLSAHLVWLSCGQDVNFFMKQTWVAAEFAFPTVIGGTLSLWLSIGLRAHKQLRSIALSLCSLGAWLVVVLAVTTHAPIATAFGGMLAFGLLIGSLLGRALDRGLPASFPLNKTIAANAAGSWLLGGLMVWAMGQALIGPHHPHQPFSDPSMLGLYFVTWIVSAATFFPATLSTIAMKAKAAGPALSMNLLLQSPLLVSLAMLPVLFAVLWAAVCINPAAVGTFMHFHAYELSPLLAMYGGQMLLAFMVPPVVAGTSIAAGSLLGARNNRKAAEREQKKLSNVPDVPAAC